MTSKQRPSNRYNPVRARLLLGSVGFSSTDTTLVPSISATPKRSGSSTAFRNTCPPDANALMVSAVASK